MTNVLLADEINTIPHPGESAREHGRRPGDRRRATLPLPRPFLVIATQNPIELEGTFPCPGPTRQVPPPGSTLAIPTPDEEGAIWSASAR